MASLRERQVWIRYRYKLGKPGLQSEEWDDRGAVTHGVYFGRTLCGVDIHSKTIQDGWTVDSYARQCDPSFVTCRRCVRILEREDVDAR